jgi:hypothetical protein
VSSERFKDAFRVALAMVITYAIALSMSWDKPFWAALSVAFCSLATVGDSINRGIQRIVGTLLAGVVTVLLVALFPQERWPFLVSMSAVLALCTYRMTGSPRYFFIWFATGFTIPILAILGGGLALNSFETIILRLQETALGVVVYSVVAVLLWPRPGSVAFEDAVRSVCADQRQLLRLYLGAMIFVATFVIAYALHRPQSAIAKAMGLTTLVIIVGVENEQSYSFLYFANWFMVMVMFVSVLVAAWQFPIRFWPQGRFVSTLRRFFRSSQFLLSPSRAAVGQGESTLSR